MTEEKKGAPPTLNFSDKPLHFISLEVERGQVFAPDDTGAIELKQKPSGYLTMKLRVMAEYCHDENGKPIETPEEPPSDEWQPMTIVVYHRRQKKKGNPDAN